MGSISPEFADRYRAFFEQSTDGIWYFEVEQPIAIDLPEDEVVDAFYRAGYLAECNQSFAAMAGVPDPSTLIGMRTEQLLSQNAETGRSFLHRFVRSNYHLDDISTSAQLPDGTERHFLNNFVGVIRDGYFLSAWGTQRDITAQKQAELRIKAILHSSAEGIFGINNNGVCTFINPATVEMLGYTEAECLGENMHELVHYKRTDGSYYPIEECLIHRAIKDGKVIRHKEDILWKKDGSPLEIIYSLSPLEAGGSVITILDAEEIKGPAEALKVSEERFRSIYDANLIGIAFWTSDGYITEANDEFLQIVGYTRKEFEKVSRLSWKELTPPEYTALDMSALEAAKLRGRSKVYEKEYIRKDGTRIPIILGISLLESIDEEGVLFVIEKD